MLKPLVEVLMELGVQHRRQIPRRLQCPLPIAKLRTKCSLEKVIESRHGVVGQDAFGRDEIIVEILLGRVNPAIQDKEGYTALHLACKNGHKEVVGMLLEKGVDINSTNKEGQTALDVAIENYRQGIADYLVSQGALTGEELSQKRSSKSSEAKDGLEPSSSPTHPEKKPVSLEPEDSTRGHQ